MFWLGRPFQLSPTPSRLRPYTLVTRGIARMAASWNHPQAMDGERETETLFSREQMNSESPVMWPDQTVRK